MSKRNRPRLSLPGDRNDKTMAPTVPPPAVTSAPIQEKQMDQSQEKQEPQAPEQIGPTAKQMAAVEEANAKRLIDQGHADEARALAADWKPPNLRDLAAKGRDALAQGLRQQPPKPAYVPPQMTDRQKTQLQEEMEAGAKRVRDAEARKIVAGHPTLPPPRDNNEGLTTPVYRDGEHVPGMAKMPLTRGS